MSKMLWVLLSYPLTLVMVYMPVVFPLDGLENLIYVLVLDLIWIILALWFGCYYFKYISLRDLRSLAKLMTVNILSLVIMFLIMAIPWVGQQAMTEIIASGADYSATWFALIPSVSCFIVFAMVGLACKQKEGGPWGASIESSGGPKEPVTQAPGEGLNL